MTWLLRRSDGRTVPVGNRAVRVGRDPANDIAVPDGQVSRLHATFWVRQGQLYVRDEGSTNGTFCNGVRLADSRPLSPGDRLQIGTLALEVATGNAARAGSALPLLPLAGAGILLLAVIVFLSQRGARQGQPGLAPLPSGAGLTPSVAPPAASPTPTTPPATPDPQAALQHAVRAVVKVGLLDGTDTLASWGSGSIVTAGGLALTNYHVIVDALANPGWRIQIYTEQNAQQAPVAAFLAVVKAYDEDLDLAVLQLQGPDGSPLPPSSTLPAIPLGDSDQLQIGDDITILGFPDIGGETVNLTKGTVSGFHADGTFTRGWIKTDAEVSPGNSGGMALDTAGNLIGIPTWVSAEDLTLGRIGVLRPVNLAKPLINQALQADLGRPGPCVDGRCVGVHCLQPETRSESAEFGFGPGERSVECGGHAQHASRRSKWS